MQFDDADDIPGTEAWSADGRSLGRISAVHVPVDGVQPLLVQLPAGADQQYVVPMVRAELRGEGLVLGYDEATIADGPRVAAAAVLSVGEAAYVLERFGIEVLNSAGLPLTDRVTGVGDVGSVHPGVRALPAIGADPDLPPIVVISPGADPDSAR